MKRKTKKVKSWAEDNKKAVAAHTAVDLLNAVNILLWYIDDKYRRDLKTPKLTSALSAASKAVKTARDEASEIYGKYDLSDKTDPISEAVQRLLDLAAFKNVVEDMAGAFQTTSDHSGYAMYYEEVSDAVEAVIEKLWSARNTITKSLEEKLALNSISPENRPWNYALVRVKVNHVDRHPALLVAYYQDIEPPCVYSQPLYPVSQLGLTESDEDRLHGKGFNTWEDAYTEVSKILAASPQALHNQRGYKVLKFPNLTRITEAP